jgi:hypothetical protein
MGFTRYWTRPREFDTQRFATFAAACAEVCSEFEDCIMHAVFSDEKVSFEGTPGCEPFVIERVSFGREREGNVFGFCKTQELQYDDVVERCLELVASHFAEITIPEPS